MKHIDIIISELQETNANLRAEAEHWKSNHDEMVKRNRILRARHDLTAEQVADREGILQYLAELQGEVAMLRIAVKEHNRYVCELLKEISELKSKHHNRM